MSNVFTKIVQLRSRARDLLYQTFTYLWKSNSGAWKWFTEDSRTLSSLNQELWRGAIPSANFYLMLFLSSIVCRAKHSLSIAVIILSILGIPLGFSLNHLLIREKAHQRIEYLVRQRYSSVSQIDIRRIRVESATGSPAHVFVELVAPEGAIRDEDRQKMESQLESALDMDIALRLRIVPSYELSPSP